MAYNNFNNSKTHYSQQQQNNNVPKPEPFVPLSSDAKTKLKNPNCNFSLYSPKMVSWKFLGKELKVDDSVIVNLCAQSKKSFTAVMDFLSCKQKRQKDYLELLKQQGVQVFSFIAKTTSPFVTGIGSGHPTETGMILDRNLGVPYIPASSIKGVLRLACAINLAMNNEEYAKNGIVPDEDTTLVKYFGSMSQETDKQTRGQLMFLDAYPENNVNLKVDIMNPHFGKYYSGEHKQPVETESPVPIKFLTVEKGTKFIFNCAFMPLKNSENCNEQEITEMFTTAFEKVGFGGKTAIGYGRFKKIVTGAPTK